MKKIILTATMALCTVGLFAQSSGSASSGLTSKKGETILPEAGDWSIGFDAAPFLTYFGNFLSNVGGTSPTANFLNGNNTIMGKYFVDETTAYRGLVRIGITSTTNEHMTNADLNGATVAPFPTPQVSDQMKTSSHFVGLGAGMEKRKGKTRLQGYYGAELFFWLSGTDTKYTYGNAYNLTTNPSPQWFNFSSNSTSVGLPRTTEMKAGSTFGVSLQGFIGFEYFFMAKISIGAEYTWGLNFQSTGQGTQTVEEVNPTSGASQSDSYKTGKSGGFSLDDGINTAWGASSGNLYIHFHF
jgi:hypothetical protein